MQMPNFAEMTKSEVDRWRQLHDPKNAPKPPKPEKEKPNTKPKATVPAGTTVSVASLARVRAMFFAGGEPSDDDLLRALAAPAPAAAGTATTTGVPTAGPAAPALAAANVEMVCTCGHGILAHVTHDAEAVRRGTLVSDPCRNRDEADRPCHCTQYVLRAA